SPVGLQPHPSDAWRTSVVRSARVTAFALLLLAAPSTRMAFAVDGAWSDFGPKMTHNQPSTAGGNPPIVVARGNIYVSDRTGVNRMSLSAPNGWTYLSNGAPTNRVGRMVV